MRGPAVRAKLLRLYEQTPLGMKVVMERLVPLPGENQLGAMHLDQEAATYLRDNLTAMLEEWSGIRGNQRYGCRDDGSHTR